MRSPEVLIKTPNAPDRFVSLAQGSDARLAQIEAGKRIGDEEILVLEDPQTTLFARLKESLSRSLKPVRGRVAVPVGMVLLTIAAACSGGGKDKPPDAGGSESFSDNLPAELFDACREYINNDEFGGEGDYKGYDLANGYLEDNPTDSRALYLMGIGAYFTAEFEDALPALIVVSGREDLPSRQAQLAEDMANGILDASKTDDIIERLNLIMEPETKVREDLRTVCPEGKIGGLGVGDEESVISAEESEIRGLIECGLESDGACLNRLLELHEKSLPIMLKEILRNDVEHEYAPGAFRPITNVLDIMTATLLRMDENYPEEVNGVIEDVVTTLECLTVNPCDEIEIGQENVRLGFNRIDSLTGRNALAFLQTVANDYPPPAGKNLVLPYTERLKQIRDWLEQREDEEDSYRLISYDLLVMISDLEE